MTALCLPRLQESPVLHPQGAQDKVSPAPAGRGGAAPTLAYDSDEEKGESTPIEVQSNAAVRGCSAVGRRL